MEELLVTALGDLLSLVERKKASGVTVFVLFCGSRLENGESWCSDCVKAEPVVAKVAKERSGGVLVHCAVGDRDEWKSANNEYRTHPQLRLTAVPTLLQWGSNKRLVEEECAKEDLVRMLFEED